MKPKTCLSMAICLACTVAAHPSPDGDSAAVATERWSLQRCLDYASERNLNIKISEINAESSDIDVRTAKSAFLPSLSANVSQRIVNNPRSENNTIIDGDRISSSQSKTSYNGSYGIDLQWTLYEGNRRLNDYKQQKVASQIARLNVDESINNIQESIMQAYIQILYAAEAVEINRATLASSQAERLRGEELLAAGTLSQPTKATTNMPSCQPKRHSTTINCNSNNCSNSTAHKKSKSKRRTSAMPKSIPSCPTKRKSTGRHSAQDPKSEPDN